MYTEMDLTLLPAIKLEDKSLTAGQRSASKSSLLAMNGSADSMRHAVDEANDGDKRALELRYRVPDTTWIAKVR